MFAGVAAFSLATKYLVRYRGSHVFNPSNIGLVVAFIVLGSERVEPLDFWWAPLDRGMLAAYAVIVVGGVLITRRLELLAAAATFWIALAAGVGLLAASGHCMVARWAFAPVCGFDYWRVIVTSPEVLIFLFFMITDPRTLPAGRVGRVVFALLVAVASTLLMAPQTNEFGTKVGLLGGLAVVCACRPLVDRLVPAPRSAADDLRRLVTPASAPVVLRPALAACLVVVLVVVAAAIVVAGTPARGTVVPAAADVVGRVPVEVDPATFPAISVDQEVLDWNHEITGPGAQEIVLTLAENLQLEAQALLRADRAVLEAVAHGDRLDEMEGRLRRAAAGGPTVVERYELDDVHVTLVVPFGKQVGLSLGLESRGTMTTETYDAAGELRTRTSSPFATTFVLGRPDRRPLAQRRRAAVGGRPVSDPVRWGVLGCADIAVRKVIPAMQRSSMCDVVAIASRDADRAASTAAALGVPRPYGSYDALLADPDVEAVYIPLPNHLHAPWTLRAAAAGKHVLCEKPLALSTAEAGEMIDGCRRAGVVLMEAFMYRLHPLWTRVHSLVADGRSASSRRSRRSSRTATWTPGTSATSPPTAAAR